MKASFNLAVARLTKEYQNLQKKPVKSIFAVPDYNNIFELHFVLYDLDYPYENAYFHGKILFPTDYPLKPPKLIFVTPNGR
jgi:ubiquitin-protein ligase